ncbi:MAG TPA: hypothetical protein VFT95_03740, partial [Micromonosporaceae bacterium]|nr:hypothetical protein [Micromonosporaceae bacterium]
SIAAAAVLSLTGLLFAESLVARDRLFAQAPSALAAAVPFAAGAGLVAAGTTSTTILFGGLYLLSTALVLASAAALLRVRPGTSRRTRTLQAAAAVLAGVVLASVNEIVYLAPPLVLAAVVIRGRVVLGRPWREVLTGSSARLAGWLWLGFLPVFALTRALIYGHCRDGGCYRGSDLALGVDALAALPNRMVSWLPPLMWHSATRGGYGWLVGALPLLALIVLGLLARGALRDLPRLTPVARAGALGLAALAGVLLLLGASLAALNGDVQALAARGRLGQGWRDTGITALAGGLVVVGLVAAVLARARRRRGWYATVVVLLALCAVGSTAANQRFQQVTSRGARMMLANEIAGEMADFDRSPAGNLRRCELRREFVALHPDAPFSYRRFDVSLNLAAVEREGMPFCAEAAS